MASHITTELITAAVLLGVLLLAQELGHRLGRRVATSPNPPGSGLVGPVQGAMLGLLGLLLGFSFGGAGGRFMERQDLIVQEANAIGTAYLRADLLDQPHRAELQKSLAQYLAHRVEMSKHLRGVLTDEQKTEIAGMHNVIWAAASAGVAAKPSAVIAVLDPVNEVIDLHTTRMAAGRKHFPLLLLGLLIICAALSLGVIGYGFGLGQRRMLAMSGSLAFLVAAALWIIVDLDYPRKGLIRLSDAPLQELVLPQEP